MLCRVLQRAPMPRRAAPAQRERAVEQLSRARAGAVAHGREIGDQADIPEQDREQQIADDRPEIPDQRASPLRPQRHRVRVGRQPVGVDRTAEMNDRNQSRDRDRKQRHGLGEAVDRAAPSLAGQQQHCRDQRAGIADADPPHVVGDSDAPHDGGVDAPDADAAVKQPADRAGEPEDEREACQQRRATTSFLRVASRRLGDGLRDLDIAGALGRNPAMRRQVAWPRARRSCALLGKPGAGLRTSAR